MSAERLGRLAAVMRDIQNDCARDAGRLDRTPFTPRGVGETLGSTLAMISATAKACEVLAEELLAMERAAISRSGTP